MAQIVRLEGVASAVNLQDLRSHFIGLDIPQGGITIIGGHCGVAFISFDSRVDAQHALRLSGRSLKGSVVDVLRSSISEMARSLKNFEMSRNGVHKARDSLPQHSYTSGHEREGHHSRSPQRHFDSSFRKSRPAQWQHSRSPQRYQPPQQKYVRSPPWHSQSSFSHSRSPRFRSRSPHMRSRSPRRRARSPEDTSSDPIYSGNYHVHVTNLSYSTKKKNLMNWFFNLMSEDHIRFLHDDKGRRTSECIVVFQAEKDLRKVLQRDKVSFNGRILFITPISKANVRSILSGKKGLFSHQSKGKCVYVRNFPADVKKSDIQKFFTGLSLNEEDISLLSNKHGVAIGEGLVSFSSEEDLKKAEKLHQKKYKDREIKVRRIPKEKLENFFDTYSVGVMPDDPNDCVTQEDDLLDEEDQQEYNAPHEDEQDNIADEDSGFHQTDNTNECVTQADDAPDESPVGADDASDQSLQADNDPAFQADDAPDDPAFQADDTPNNPDVQADDAPDNPTIEEADLPDDPVDQEDDKPEDPAVQVDDSPKDDDAYDDPGVQVDNAPDDDDDPGVQVDNALEDDDDPGVQVDNAPEDDDPGVQVDDAQST
ncbi:RNA-binding protein 12B-B-like isoform 1-T3 [Anomaloglossus baeobatrachus]|uniref:RNA-binding protein 12B-B-like n=1 Tax=Anomaloglossus baeobatrachus TaxID=238106 RepID=UPI003F4FAFFA